MEGGGVILHKNKEGMIEEEYLVSPVELEQIEKITNDLVVMFPEAILSKDSFGRRVDRALEYRHMDKETLDAVKKYLDNEGVTYSQSNVHLNFWFGEVSKFKACDYFFKKLLSKCSA
jgi:Lhr-like helicase